MISFNKRVDSLLHLRMRSVYLHVKNFIKKIAKHRSLKQESGRIIIRDVIRQSFWTKFHCPGTRHVGRLINFGGPRLEKRSEGERSSMMHVCFGVVI